MAVFPHQFCFCYFFDEQMHKKPLIFLGFFSGNTLFSQTFSVAKGIPFCYNGSKLYWISYTKICENG